MHKPKTRKLDYIWPFPQSIVGQVLFKNVLPKEKAEKQVPAIPLEEAPF